MRCFIHLFPDQPVTRNYKTKESATAQFITNNFPNFTWNLDKKVEIFDVLGKKVIDTTLYTKELNISNLNPGVYIIKINVDYTRVCNNFSDSFCCNSKNIICFLKCFRKG